MLYFPQIYTTNDKYIYLECIFSILSVFEIMNKNIYAYFHFPSNFLMTTFIGKIISNTLRVPNFMKEKKCIFPVFSRYFRHYTRYLIFLFRKMKSIKCVTFSLIKLPCIYYCCKSAHHPVYIFCLNFLLTF